MTQDNSEPKPTTATSSNQNGAQAPAPLVALQSPSMSETPTIISTISKSKKFAVFDKIVTLEEIRRIVTTAEEIVQQSNYSFVRSFIIKEYDKKT